MCRFEEAAPRDLPGMRNPERPRRAHLRPVQRCPFRARRRGAGRRLGRLRTEPTRPRPRAPSPMPCRPVARRMSPPRRRRATHPAPARRPRANGATPVRRRPAAGCVGGAGRPRAGRVGGAAAGRRAGLRCLGRARRRRTRAGTARRRPTARLRATPARPATGRPRRRARGKRNLFILLAVLVVVAAAGGHVHRGPGVGRRRRGRRGGARADRLGPGGRLRRQPRRRVAGRDLRARPAPVPRSARRPSPRRPGRHGHRHRAGPLRRHPGRGRLQHRPAGGVPDRPRQCRQGRRLGRGPGHRGRRDRELRRAASPPVRLRFDTRVTNHGFRDGRGQRLPVAARRRGRPCWSTPTASPGSSATAATPSTSPPPSMAARPSSPSTRWPRTPRRPGTGSTRPTWSTVQPADAPVDAFTARGQRGPGPLRPTGGPQRRRGRRAHRLRRPVRHVRATRRPAGATSTSAPARCRSR